MSYEQYIGEAGKDRDCPCDLAEDRKLLVRWLEAHILAGPARNVTIRIVEDKVDTLLNVLYDYGGTCQDCRRADWEAARIARGEEARDEG